MSSPELQADVGAEHTIRSRGDGSRPNTGTHGLRLTAETDWVLEADRETVERIQSQFPKHTERLGDRVLLLAFGNAVGRVELPGFGPVEIVSGKWGEEAFEAMLADLVQAVSSLPFSAGDQPGLPFQLSGGDDSRVGYHAFVYLRHVLSKRVNPDQRLQPQLGLVVRDPNRRWARETRTVPLEQMASVDAGSVTALLKARLDRVERDSLGSGTLSGLSDQLGGHLPTTVTESRVRSDVDTPENRFVKKFLDEALLICSAAERLGEKRGGAFGHRLVLEARSCTAQLEQVRRTRLWDSVGEATQLPLTSTVLRNRRGYREILGHWVRLRRTAEVPLNAESATALIEAKDIALLYELWCYFQVVQAAEQALGPPARIGRATATPAETRLEHEFAADWEDFRISYNGRFRRSAPNGLRRAYSTPLRPDIVLEDRRNGRVHLLDAKFRVQNKGDGQTGKNVLTFKRSDLHKMHAYRDALPAADSAWVLYPGQVFKWFQAPGSQSNNGVGVIPLEPLKDATRLSEVLEQIFN